MSDSFVTLWTVALQVPLSMRFPRQEYWSGLAFLTSGIFKKDAKKILKNPILKHGQHI